MQFVKLDGSEYAKFVVGKDGFSFLREHGSARWLELMLENTECVHCLHLLYQCGAVSDQDLRVIATCRNIQQSNDLGEARCQIGIRLTGNFIMDSHGAHIEVFVPVSALPKELIQSMYSALTVGVVYPVQSTVNTEFGDFVSRLSQGWPAENLAVA